MFHTELTHSSDTYHKLAGISHPSEKLFPPVLANKGRQPRPQQFLLKGNLEGEETTLNGLLSRIGV